MDVVATGGAFGEALVRGTITIEDRELNLEDQRVARGGQAPPLASLPRFRGHAEPMGVIAKGALVATVRLPLGRGALG